MQFGANLYKICGIRYFLCKFAIITECEFIKLARSYA